MIGTNFWTIKSSTVQVALTDKSSGDAMLAKGTVPSATAGYAKGCIFIETSTGKFFQNTGTSSSCTFNAIVTSTDTPVVSATIATTGNTDAYIIAPKTGSLSSVDFSGVDALAASDTNYITFSITNLGQAGAGSTVMLAATAANTTKATGGTAIVANGKRSLTVTGTSADLVVAAGDRLLVRAAASGTLANTVTFPAYMLRFVDTV